MQWVLQSSCLGCGTRRPARAAVRPPPLPDAARTIGFGTNADLCEGGAADEVLTVRAKA